MVQSLEIIGGAHDPPFPFIICDHFGLHVDLRQIRGQLWDPVVTARVQWGLRAADGRIFGHKEP